MNPWAYNVHTGSLLIFQNNFSLESNKYFGALHHQAYFFLFSKIIPFDKHKTTFLWGASKQRKNGSGIINVSVRNAGHLPGHLYNPIMMLLRNCLIVSFLPSFTGRIMVFLVSGYNGLDLSNWMERAGMNRSI